MSIGDSFRDEVPNVVEFCHAVGIKMTMITGDHPDVAVAVARKVGLVTLPIEKSRATICSDSGKRDKCTIVHGRDISSLTDQEWACIIKMVRLVT